MKPLIHSKSSDRTPAGPEKQERAFTLVELAVVIITLAILGALILPALAQVRRQQRADGLQQQPETVGNGLEHVFDRRPGLHALAQLG